MASTPKDRVPTEQVGLSRHVMESLAKAWGYRSDWHIDDDNHFTERPIDVVPHQT